MRFDVIVVSEKLKSKVGLTHFFKPFAKLTIFNRFNKKP